MNTHRLLLILPLLFGAGCGARSNVGKYEVSLAAKDGGPHSPLFSTCLAQSRTFEAEFASIEVVPGSEYIRYVPDPLQLASSVSWESLTWDNISSIFDCAVAAHEGGWQMFRYVDLQCQVVNEPYTFNDFADCNKESPDAVFILLPTGPPLCPPPQFFIGFDGVNKNLICGLISEDLMTFPQASLFCTEAGLYFYVNIFYTVTVADVIARFTAEGYTDKDLWVYSNESSPGAWYEGGFLAPSLWAEGFTPILDPANTNRGGYMDKTANFKLRGSIKTFLAGALCTTTPSRR